MKARTRKQQEIVARFERRGLTSSEVIPPAVARWALRTLVEPQAMASGRKAWCTDCGCEFPLDLRKAKKGKGPRVTVCPHCGKRLFVTPTRKRSVYTNGFFQQLDTDGEYQIIRMYEIKCGGRAGRQGWTSLKHVYDLWLGEGFSERWRFSVPMKMYYYRFQDPFGWGDLELRNDNHYYREDPARGWFTMGVYPRIKVQPWLEKYDVRAPFVGVDIYDLVLHVMSNREAETVWKLRNWNKDVCGYFLNHEFSTARFFRQVCLAHKHGYRIKDASMWFDHLALLEGEKRDIHNPKIIFPADLEREHQILVDREARRRRERERKLAEEAKIREEQRRLAREKADRLADKQYKKRYGKALDVTVKKGDIEIRALQNVQDFFEQGTELNQCVYGSSYYKRPDIICLCVKVAGVRTETVEVYLKEKRIGQCRGNHNQDSPRHDEILALAQRSIRKFVNACPVVAARNA